MSTYFDILPVARFLAVLLLLTVGASGASEDWWPYLAYTPAALTNDSDSSAPPPGYRFAAPDARQILLWVFEHSSLRTRTLTSCEQIAVKSGDSTLGQYVAGLIQFQTDSAAQNMFRICADTIVSPTGRRFWLCSVMVFSTNGETVLSQGVSFLVRDRTFKPLRASFRCPGSG